MLGEIWKINPAGSSVEKLNVLQNCIDRMSENKPAIIRVRPITSSNSRV
jgi:hypothetical protein